MCCCMCSRRLRWEGVEPVVARCCGAQEGEGEAGRVESSLSLLALVLLAHADEMG